MFEAGVFLIDKPVGLSSFKIVQRVRRALQIKKVGHSGTLDPFASGLLIICAGRSATRIISQLMEGDKKYEALLKLGVETDTCDPEGQVISTGVVAGIDLPLVEGCLEQFRGEQMQVPPQYSALKHKGKPLYYYARKGIVIEKEARRILIRELTSEGLSGDELKIQVCCSKGTYIRTLASDIGKKLGCGAYLTQLRRTVNGPFSVENAISGDLLLGDLQKAHDLLVENSLTVEEALNRINAGKQN